MGRPDQGRRISLSEKNTTDVQPQKPRHRSKCVRRSGNIAPPTRYNSPNAKKKKAAAQDRAAASGSTKFVQNQASKPSSAGSLNPGLFASGLSQLNFRISRFGDSLLGQIPKKVVPHIDVLTPTRAQRVLCERNRPLGTSILRGFALGLRN